VKAGGGGMGWRRKIVDSGGIAFECTISSPHLALASSFLGGLATGLSGLGVE